MDMWDFHVQPSLWLGYGMGGVFVHFGCFCELKRWHTD